MHFTLRKCLSLRFRTVWQFHMWCSYPRCVHQVNVARAPNRAHQKIVQLVEELTYDCNLSELVIYSTRGRTPWSLPIHSCPPQPFLLPASTINRIVHLPYPATVSDEIFPNFPCTREKMIHIFLHFASVFHFFTQFLFFPSMVNRKVIRSTPVYSLKF